MKVFKFPVEQTDPSRSQSVSNGESQRLPNGESPREALPTMYDLPSEDPEEPGLPDEFHDFQPQLLSATLRIQNYAADQIFTASDLNLYYDVDHHLWHKRPDWFLVVGVPRFYDERDLRLSYVMWQEGVSPMVVVELLSPGTEKEDLGQTDRKHGAPPTKWEVYEQILRVPYYVVFDRYTDRLRVFSLTDTHYQELTLTGDRLWLPELNIGLGVWEGTYQGSHRRWLRWYGADGTWVPTDSESLIANRALLEAERERADRLAERLRSLGIDPD